MARTGPYLLGGCLTGALLALATAQVGLGVVGFLGLVPLLVAIDRGVSPRSAALGGWLGGILFFSVALAWIPLSGFRGTLLVLAFGYVCVLALSFAGFAGAVAWMHRRDRALALLVAPLFWVTAELVRTQGTFGYPWHHVGYALAEHASLMQLAAFGGVYALSLWIVSVSAMLVGGGGLSRRTRVVAWGVLAIPVLLGPRALDMRPAHEVFRVAAVQPGVEEPGRREDALLRRNLTQLVKLTEEGVRSRPDLVIWPESAFERAVGPGGDPLLSAVVRRYEVPLLTGAWRIEGAPRVLHNSALLIDTNGEITPAGDKVHPVAFYEGTPSSEIERFVAGFGLWPGRFVRGDRSGLVRIERADGTSIRVGVLICVDSSYPDLARDLHRRGAQLLVEISNEAQTGSWSAWQHALLSRVRAVETGLPLVRVANAGPTEWIDGYGRVIARLPPGVVGVEAANVPLIRNAPPYTTLGDGPVFACALAPVVLLALRRRRKAPNSLTEEIRS
ncbi:MAG: apolipoprotein N-acyltransferase [Myxococcota bacterium]